MSLVYRAASAFAVAAAAVTFAAPAGADPASLYKGPPPRPGPDVLYAPLASSPQLESAPGSVWHAPPILVSGASAYRGGEFVYQDWLYDDHGAAGAYRDQNDPQKAPGGVSTSGDLFSTPNGTYTYPTDRKRYMQDAADFVELRVRPLSDATAIRITLNSMNDPADVGESIALGGTPGVAFPFPYGANVSAPADLFLTVHGASADLRRPGVVGVDGGVVDGAVPVSVDRTRRQIEVRVPHADWNPGVSTVRLAAGVGLWDKRAGRYLLPLDNADATHPGGAGGLGAAAPAFFNVAFRFEHATGSAASSEEPVQGPSDTQQVVTDPAWWRDKGQAHALKTGDISPFFVNVDFAKLAAGTSDDMPGGSQGVPVSGPMDRILVSHTESEQGRDYSAACASATLCDGELRGRLQPYAIFVPPGSAPPGGWGMTLLLHSLSANYNQYLGSHNMAQFGSRAPGSIVITPAGRGPDGWYYDEAGADTFEVWADVAARYRLNPAFSVVTGYSMGGYGTYKFATQFPDLFAKGQPTVGPPGLGIWVPPSAPTGGESTNSYDQLASLRNVPFLIWNASTDELVPTPGPVAQQQRFGALGLRYEFDLFAPAEHLTLAANDQFQPAADFLGPTKVDYNPPHVTYVYNPSMDFPARGTGAGHAYWVSGVTLRDQSAALGRGTIDVRSDGFGVGDPAPSGVSSGAGTLTGGSVPVISYFSQAQTWGAAPTAPIANTLHIAAANVSAVTIDAARAHVSCGAIEDVSSDGPLAVNLSDCPGGAGARAARSSLERSCGSARVLTLHVARAHGAKVRAVKVVIGGRRVESLKGSDLKVARVDLRGLPRGAFRVRVTVEYLIGSRRRVQTLTRLFHTCAVSRHSRRRVARRHGWA